MIASLSAVQRSFIEWMKLLNVAILYCLLIKAHALFFVDKSILGIMWPASGVALAIVLIGGERYALSIFVGAWAQIVSGSDKSLLVSALLALAPTVEALIGLWLIRRYRPLCVQLHSVEDYFHLLGFAVFSCLVGVLFSHNVLFVEKWLRTGSSYSLSSYLTHLLHWWQGDMLGVLLFTPLFLLYRFKINGMSEKKWLEISLAIVGAWLLGQVVFLDWGAFLFAPLAKGYWPFLVVVVAAVRLGVYSVLMVLLIFTAQALLGAKYDTGLFGYNIANGHFFSYLVSLSLTGVTLAIHTRARHRVEQQLRESSETFQHLFDDAHDALLLIKGELIVDCNHAAWALLGFSSKIDLRQRQWRHFLPLYQTDEQQSNAHLETMIAIAMRDGYHRFECLLRKRDSCVFPVEVTLTKISVRGESLMHTHCRDMTKQKALETKLRERNGFFESLAQINPVGIYQTDAQGYCTFLTERYSEITGFGLAQAQGGGWLNAIIPEDRERVLTEWQQSVTHKRPFILEYRFKHPDGRIIWVYGQSVAMYDDAKQLIGFIGTITDVTHYKATEAALRNGEERFRSLFDQAPMGLALIDSLTGRVYTANQKYTDIVGLSLSELQSIDWMRITHPDDIQKDLDNMNAMNAGKINGFSIEKRYLRSDGSIVWVNLTVAPVRVAEQTLPRHYCIIEDITARKQAETQLRIAAIAFESQESMLVTDAAQTVIKINQTFTTMTGYSANDIVGQKPTMLSSGKHDAAFYQAMWQSIKQQGSWRGEIWNRRKNGEIYPELITITAVKDDNGVVTHYVSSAIDITERKAAEEHIANLAFYDPLTQLPNRRLLYESLKHGIEVNRREGAKMAILMLDLDGFKNVNDNFGHAAGDELLQQVAQRIKNRLRDVDMIARLGGDEFTVLLQIKQDNDAGLVANAMIKTLSEPFELNHQFVTIGASIGISLLPQHGNDPDTLISHADKALYAAKRQGKGLFVYFKPEMN